jgi:hypothetical protein
MCYGTTKRTVVGVVKGYKDETCLQQGTKNRKMFTLSCTYKL